MVKKRVGVTLIDPLNLDLHSRNQVIFFKKKGLLYIQLLCIRIFKCFRCLSQIRLCNLEHYKNSASFNEIRRNFSTPICHCHKSLQVAPCVRDLFLPKTCLNLCQKQTFQILLMAKDGLIIIRLLSLIKISLHFPGGEDFLYSTFPSCCLIHLCTEGLYFSLKSYLHLFPEI